MLIEHGFIKEKTGEVFGRSSAVQHSQMQSAGRNCARISSSSHRHSQVDREELVSITSLVMVVKGGG